MPIIWLFLCNMSTWSFLIMSHGANPLHLLLQLPQLSYMPLFVCFPFYISKIHTEVYSLFFLINPSNPDPCIALLNLRSAMQCLKTWLQNFIVLYLFSLLLLLAFVTFLQAHCYPNSLEIQEKHLLFYKWNSRWKKKDIKISTKIVKNFSKSSYYSVR